MYRDIVITGCAIACPLGLSRDAAFARLCRGECGTGGSLNDLESSACVASGGGQAPPLPDDFFPDLPRESRYLRRVTIDALQDAKLDNDRDRSVGIVVGSTLHGIRGLGRYLRTGDAQNLLQIPAGNTLAQAVNGLGIDAIRLTTCSACSSGLSSIALACDLLRCGMVDVALAGGYDAIAEYSHAGFASLRLVSAGPCTPFCVGREGMKVAEGYGLVVLERSSDAADRNATVWAHVAATSETSDVHHLTHPHPEGRGARAALEAALHDAGLSPDDIDLIIAHATGTPTNDLAEHAALYRVFKNHLDTIPIIALKSNLGHTLGGAGAIELVLSLMCREAELVPPAANLADRELEVTPLRIVTGQAEPRDIAHSVQLSLGFGGANACVVLSPHSVESEDARAAHEVVLTGIGVVVPGVIGNIALLNLLSNPKAAGHLPNAPDADACAGLLTGRRVRRMSEYSRLTIAATSLAFEHAGIQDPEEFGSEASAILGTFIGSAAYAQKYYRQIVEEGLESANPMLFAEGVPNAAAAQLGMAFGVRGGCQAIIGTLTAGLDALALAVMRIRDGVWTRAIVSAADECSELTSEGLRRCRNAEPSPPIGSGAVSLILESSDVAMARASTPIAALSRPHLAFSSEDADGSIDVLVRAIGEGASAAIGSSPKSLRVERAAARILRIEHHSLVSCPHDVLSAGPLLSVAAAALGADVAGRRIPSGTSVVAADGSGSVSSIRVGRSRPAV